MEHYNIMFQKCFHKRTNLEIELHAKPNIFYGMDILKHCSLKTSTQKTKPQKLFTKKLSGTLIK